MLEPLGYRCLIKPRDVDSVTKGGIVLPEQVTKAERMATQIGYLAAIGSDAKVGTAKIGDKVLFAKYGGRYIKDPETGNDLVILNDEDVLLVYREEEDNE